MRQQLLILYLVNSSPDSRVIAWSLWDGTGKNKTYSGDSDSPPYETGYDALLDGWRLIQMTPMIPAQFGDETRTSFLHNEFIFEKLIDK